MLSLWNKLTRVCVAIVMAGMLLNCSGQKNDSCPTGQQKCGDVCVNVNSDRAHCGACDNACAKGQVCNTGTCQANCQNGLEECNGSCADILTNTAHCGACGKVCQSGEYCDNGTCRGVGTQGCPNGTTDCNGSCYDLQANAANCGACGNTCQAGEVCANGTCTPTSNKSCTGGTTDCSGACANLKSDRNNCGGCGNKCASGFVCSNGQCELTCQSSQTDCSGSCVDTKTDRFNCGGCGRACEDAEVCVAGKCVANCATGQRKCNAQCVNLQSDNKNCGSCGNACNNDEVCRAGRCESFNCPTGFQSCFGRCVDSLSDRSNCGACGNICKQGEVCDNGSCTLTCQAGLAKCNGTCVNTLSNRKHCGACGNICAAGQVCSQGTCQLSCPANQNSCDGNCTSTQVDRFNCGGCRIRCAAGEVCSSGKCVTTCNTQQTNCRGNCVDTQTDPNNCGTCGTVCKRNEACVSGSCQLNCAAPYQACNGTCVDFQNDPNNCGTCGKACAANEACTKGACISTCPLGSQVCSGACVNTTSNPKNCGACGNVCGAGESCVQGTCKVCRDCPLWATNTKTYEYDAAEDVAVDSNGEIVFVGTFEGKGIFGNKPLQSRGIRDAFIAKLDKNGKYKWVINAGGAINDNAKTVATDSKGNIYVAGTFMAVGTFGTTNMTSQGGTDIFVAKVDTDGNWVWAKRFGGASTDKALSIVVDNNDQPIIAGFHNGPVAFGTTTLASKGTTDAFVAKLDDKGNVLWANNVGGPLVDLFNAVAVDNANNVYVTGETSSLQLAAANTTLTTTGESDVILAKYNAKGVMQMVKVFGGLGGESGLAIHVDGRGQVTLAGQFEDRMLVDGRTITSKGGFDVFVIRWNANGQLVWITRGGGAGTEIPKDIVIDSLGRTFITGLFNPITQFGNARLLTRGGFDLFVAQMDTAGAWVGLSQGTSSVSASGNAIAVDTNDALYIAGQFNSALVTGQRTMLTSGSDDAFVFKYPKPGLLCESESHDVCNGLCTNIKYSELHCGACSSACSGDRVCNNGACKECTDCNKWLSQGRSTTTEKGQGNISAVAVDSQDNIYVTGDFNNTIRFGSFQLKAKGSADVFVAKADKAGNWLWAKSYGSSTFETSSDIKVDSKGNVYFAGYFINRATFGTKTLISEGGPDAFVAKLDTKGAFIWATSGGGLHTDKARGLAIGPNDTLYVSGLFSDKEVTFGALTLKSTTATIGSSDAFVARIDKTGKWTWIEGIGGGAGDDVAEQIAVDSKGNAYVVGSFFGTLVFNTSTTLNAGSTIRENILVFKLDPTGKRLWARQAGTRQTNARGLTIATDANGVSYVGGRFEGSATFGQKSIGVVGGQDAFVAQIDTNGAWGWAKGYGTQKDDAARALRIDSKGNIVVAGNFHSVMRVGLIQLLGGIRDQCFVIKLTKTGGALGAASGGGVGYDYCNGVALESNDDIVFAGYSTSSTLYFRNEAIKRGTASEPTPFVGSYPAAICPSSGAHDICNGRCTLLSGDVKNCGSCGNACAAGQVCTGGTCF